MAVENRQIADGIVDLTAVETVPELFVERVRLSPDAPAWLTRSEERWVPTSWAQADAEVRRVAAGLAALGVRSGSAVAVIAWTRPEWCVADLAIQSLGAVCVGIYPTLTTEQVRFVLDDAGCSVVLVEDAAQFEKVAAWAAADPAARQVVVIDVSGREIPGSNPWAELRGTAARDDAAAMILYTSGTTGRPKGVVLTHRAIIELLRMGESTGEIRPGDVTMAFLPMAHAAEHVLSFYSRIRFGAVAAFARSIESVLDDAREVAPDYFGAVPRIFEKLHQGVHRGLDDAPLAKRTIARVAFAVGRERARTLREGRRPPAHIRLLHPLADRLVLSKLRDLFGGRVRYFVSGAAPISVEILEFFHGCGMLVLEGYGLTEAAGLTHINRVDDFRFGTVGKPLPGVECRVARDGEIFVRSPAAFAGYHGLPDETADMLDADGWLHTGDIGEIDDDGFLRITDRKKHLLKTAGGKYVAPAPIEIAVAQEDPWIGQVFVEAEGRPYVAALVALDPSEHEDAAQPSGVPDPEVVRRIAGAVERANRRLARYEQVRRFAVVTDGFSLETGELTPTLKVRRDRVRERHGMILDGLYDGTLGHDIASPPG